MSRYGYDYSLTSGRPRGWRSLFRNVLSVGAIAGISAVSGVVVVLDLLGSGSAVHNRVALVTEPTHPVSVWVAGVPSPVQPAATTAGAAVETPPAADVTASAATAQPPAPPTTTTPPQTAETASTNAASTVSAVAVEDPKTLQVPERDLTFSKGYARRRAAQTAATTGSGSKTEVARAEAQNHVGRVSKAKPKSSVAHQSGDQRRDGREERQQAFAFGEARDPRAYRRPPPQRQGGLFSSNPFGGFFRGTF